MSGRKINLIGQQFGRWTVLSESGKTKQGSITWLCKCECGNEKIVSASTLRNKDSKSCGCLEKEVNERKNIIGDRYGKLVIIGLTENRKIVKVRCDCGTEKLVRICNFRTTKSCGCWKATGKWVVAGNKKEFGEAAKNSLFSSYKREANERGYSFNISFDHFCEITKMECHYCGAEPKQRQRGDNGDYIYNGIDRVNNNIGYEPFNIVPCCRRCNRAKDVMNINEFKNWIISVHENFASKKILKAI